MNLSIEVRYAPEEERPSRLDLNRAAERLNQFCAFVSPTSAPPAVSWSGRDEEDGTYAVLFTSGDAGHVEGA